MRRLSDITIQVDDRFASPKGPVHPQTPTRMAVPRRRGMSPYVMKRVRRALMGVSLLALMTGLPAWAYVSGSYAKAVAELRQDTVDLTGRAGFRVQDIFVEGRSRTSREELMAALQVQRGDPIFGVDLTATRQRLEEISWVKTATLERRLPGELHILLSERNPIAVWQNQGHYYLIDKDGLVVGDQLEDFPDLPLVVGEGAPDHAAALLEMLALEPDLQKRVRAAQWVSNRRWNITFDHMPDGVDVRLPEEAPEETWHELARIEKEQQVLERKVTLIDMRLPDRLVMRSTGGAEENSPAAQKAKHKGQPGKDA